MTIAFFSDVHANRPALEAVLADIEDRVPDMVFCLGDLVGYAPWPNEVVQKVRAYGIPTLAGNYDAGVGMHSDDCGCAYKTDEDRARGAASIAYTNEVVSPVTRAYLRELPRQMRLDFPAPSRPGDAPMRLLMVHGSPRRINHYLFEDYPDDRLLRMMEEADADVMLFGHTHKPYYKVLPYQSRMGVRYRHAINIGSVGKPKDGDPRACYALVDLDILAGIADPSAVQVHFMRMGYDVESAATAIERSPLPDAFADMLRYAY